MRKPGPHTPARPPQRRLPQPPITALMLAIPEDTATADALPVVSRPDGYYWQAPDGHQEVGPFETYELACADRDRDDVEGAMPGEAWWEAEDGIGITESVDPGHGDLETGPWLLGPRPR